VKGLESNINLECSDENILFFAWSVDLHWQLRISHFIATILYVSSKKDKTEALQTVLDLGL
jgi:hypothetical protein